MERLVNIADEVGQNPDGELLVRLGFVRVSKNILVARNLCRSARSVRTVLAMRLPPAAWNVVVVPGA